MFGLGMPELVVIMGITFLIFGGKKLPELGAGLGKGLKAFKTGLRDVDEHGKPTLEEGEPGRKEVNVVKN
ncbi:MAG: twin-arginine translocase TatA/TatE family subunit [Proteobacteria bacterium]|nr:twin-arginine translocase TatA/TatE family subunit [Pseudomonadota bacterium]MBU1717273.1 twin-arginine translocase TatA/TatE family subunit [Pseudomonadota bacterium]